MAKKSTKADKLKGGLGGAKDIVEAHLKDSAARAVGNLEVNALAIPLARFIILAEARNDVSDAERAEFGDALRLARGSWTELRSLLDEIKQESLRHEMTLAIDALCAGVAAMARFMPPADIMQRQVVSDGTNAHARKMREAKGPDIERRKALLGSGKFNLEEVVAHRKLADAIAVEFARMCEEKGLKPVTGRQLQRDAEDILEERREKLGHS